MQIKPILLFLPLALAFTACGDTKSGERMEDDVENAADNAGDAIERGVDNAGDAMERAGNDVENAANRVGNDVENAANRVGNNVEDAGGHVGHNTGSNRRNDAMPYLDQTIKAVSSNRNDMTSIPVATALTYIDGWIERLDGVDGMYEIREGLKELKEELTEETIKSKAVGGALNALGEDVAELKNPALKSLSDALKAAGKKLDGR